MTQLPMISATTDDTTIASPNLCTCPEKVDIFLHQLAKCLENSVIFQTVLGIYIQTFCEVIYEL